MTNQEILNNCMVDLNGSDVTLREYFRLLLTELYNAEDGFSGKRPFGNSGWVLDILAGLGRIGVIKATFDSYGYLEDVDEDRGHAVVFELIDEVFK